MQFKFKSFGYQIVIEYKLICNESYLYVLIFSYKLNGNIIECIIYSIPRSLKDTYIQTYNTIIYEINIDHSNAIEKLLYDHSHDINRLEYLNVYGRDAIEGFDNLV